MSNLPASPRPDTVSASSAPLKAVPCRPFPDQLGLLRRRVFRPTDVGGIPTPFGRRRLSPSPTVLSLDKALPSASRPEEGPRLCTGVSAEMFDFIFKPFAWDLLCRDWTCVPDLSPTAASFLRGLRPFTPARQPSAMQLYVDGSFGLNSTGQVRSGWSLCILCQVDSEWLWAGFLAVTCGAGGDSTLQAPVRSAFETELAALVHALAWCVAMPFPAAVFFDSQSAGAIAEGAAVLSMTRMHFLRRRLRSCICWWCNVGPRPFAMSGHTRGSPLMSSARARQRRLLGALPDTLWQAQEQQVLPWLWTAL